jgi:hypothetical protein
MTDGEVQLEPDSVDEDNMHTIASPSSINLQSTTTTTVSTTTSSTTTTSSSAISESNSTAFGPLLPSSVLYKLHYVAYDFLQQMKETGRVVEEISKIVAPMLKCTSHFVYVPPSTISATSTKFCIHLCCILSLFCFNRPSSPLHSLVGGSSVVSAQAAKAAV